MENSSYSIVSKVVVAFCALMVLIGLFFGLSNIGILQSKFSYILFFLIATGVAAVLIPIAWKGYNKSGEGKYLWMGGLTTLFWFLIVVGVVSSAKQMRGGCVPPDTLIHSNGYIPNPDAYLSFHTQCKGNTVAFTNATVSYIRTNNKLPDWIVRNGQTDDVTGFVKAHGLPLSAVHEFGRNGKVPEKYLK